MDANQSESGECWRIVVSPGPLSLDEHVQWVADPGAGAISTFSGVTRDNFGGKAVMKLEYECYVPMALRKLKVCRSALPIYALLLALCHADLSRKRFNPCQHATPTCCPL